MVEKLELTPQESGAKGGKERARRLSSKRRSDIARAGAVAKWAKEGKEVNEPIPVAYGEEDRPLRIGNAVIPCYVLADGTRVLTQRGLQAALGFSRSAGKGGARRLVAFLAGLARKGMALTDLTARAETDIRFTLPRGGSPALAYNALILEELCEVIDEAERKGKLASNQMKLAEQARVLRRGFARIGIIALVDEATGYQKDRPAMALAEILDAFIARELRPWVKRFPFEFYTEIFRLRGWDASDLTPSSPKPIEVGKITVELIYRRLAPGVRKSLTTLTERNAKGYLKSKLHQWLSADIGDPKLEALIGKIITTMRLSDDWPSFMRNLERAGIHRYDDNLQLPFPEFRRIPEPDATSLAMLAFPASRS